MSEVWVKLFQSRKFWLVIWDFITATVVFVLDQLGASFKPDVLFLIGAMQPVYYMVISSISIDDAATMRAGIEVDILSPLRFLIQSKKFWLLILDQVISTVVYFVGTYNPASLDSAKVVIGMAQPLFLVLIGAIAYEDKVKIEVQALKLPRFLPPGKPATDTETLQPPRKI